MTIYLLLTDDYVRGYPSDKFAYEKIIEQIENSEYDKNFVFCVTMQNHGGYDYGWNDQDVELYVEDFGDDKAISFFFEKF